MADLFNYETGDYIREATAEEVEASDKSALVDGGTGAIEVEIDGEMITVYTLQ